MSTRRLSGVMRLCGLLIAFVAATGVTLCPGPSVTAGTESSPSVEDAGGTPGQALKGEMPGDESRRPGQPFKILHVMSYHSNWEWTDDLMQGFMDGTAGMPAEYRSFEMDTKRRNSEEWKQEVGREARNIIDAWKPDLVYATDDNAQKHVTSHYINSRVPFVFSAVNGAPAEYGFVGSSNITGVQEHEHFVETVNLLCTIVPKIRKIAIIVDEDPTWNGVIERMKAKVAIDLNHLDFVSWDVVRTFDDYKERVLRYQGSVDALGLLGIHTFKDAQGTNVPWQQVVRWTAENSNLPDFTFWKDRISYGTLCAVYVSGYEQGHAAGRMARSILVEGKEPSSIPMQPSRKGEPIVSLARARKLGIQVSSETLLTARVVRSFAWQDSGEK
ncbi:MAG: ABC transporter substrate-binding protein [Syntrophobacteraceae bacterium]